MNMLIAKSNGSLTKDDLHSINGVGGISEPAGRGHAQASLRRKQAHENAIMETAKSSETLLLFVRWVMAIIYILIVSLFAAVVCTWVLCGQLYQWGKRQFRRAKQAADK
jgi:hypothetical protein